MAKDNNTNENRDKMEPAEAGRMGGEATLENHDKKFYQEIGKKAAKPLLKVTVKNFTKKSAAKAEMYHTTTMTIINNASYPPCMQRMREQH